MNKKSIQTQDKYVLRLPDGLRDRIKAYAERHGRSMNAEIVRVLEREYPPPKTIVDSINEILETLEFVKTTPLSSKFDKLSSELFNTIEGIIDGSVQGVPDDERSAVMNQYDAWSYDRDKYENISTRMDLDDEEIESMENRRGTVKYPHQRPSSGLKGPGIVKLSENED